MNTLSRRLAPPATALVGAIALLAPAARAESFDCVISPAVTVGVGSPVTGLLDKVTVDQGDLVTEGQEIAVLRSEVERKTVELLEVQAKSTAEIEAQESRLDLSMKRLERARDLEERNVGTMEQLEVAEAEVEVITRELAIARMRREVAGMEWQRAKAQLDQRVIRSPLDGVVTARLLYGGEFFGTDDVVVTIAQVDPLHVEAFLPVGLHKALAPGETLLVAPDAPVEGTIEAQIDVIDRVFDPASGTFGIRLILPNPDGKIPAGHRCRVDIPMPNQ